MKRPIIIHPILLSVYPILFLYAHNVSELGYVFSWLSLLILASLVLIAIVYLIIRRFTKERIKAGIYASLFLVFFFSYEYFRNILTKLNKIVELEFFNHQYATFLFFWLLIFITFFYFLKRIANFAGLNKFLNIFASTLMVFILFSVVSHVITEKKIDPDDFTAEDKRFIQAIKADNKQLPDVYYILPDGYGNLDVIKEYFGYDNAEFIDFLNKRGFQLARNSTSNYHSTQLSLSSALAMDYLDSSVVEGSALAMEKIRNPKVARIFKELGYKFVTFDSGWSMDSHSRAADIFYRGGYFDEFPLMFFQTTALQPFFSGEGRLGYSMGDEMRKRILFTFDKLGNEVPKIGGPKFIFAHINLPHDPYVFGPNGEKVFVKGAGETFTSSDLSAWLGFAIFGAKKISATVDGILENSATPPIIIVQSDHGFTPAEDYGSDGNSLDDALYRDEGLRIRFSNLSAYYLPGMSKKLLPSNMTPVNTFRLIFNNYFGAKYPFLDNKHYYTRENGGNFKEVSQKIFR